MSRIYVHDGGQFDINRFTPIKNRNFVKPSGGLWGSPLDSACSWKQWCKSNNFNHDKYNKNNEFLFKLKDNARLLYIDNAKMLDNLPKIHDEILSSCFVILDFEELAKSYDAIEVSISADEQLYWDLYGWDVDSILVMNPGSIEIIDKEKII